ncbi:MAG: hypothetical protein AAFO77_02050, partial [Pseudomonadota bacterium]
MIKTEQQLCFRALCGMYDEAEKARQCGRGVRAQIVCLAMNGLRGVSESNGHCDDCPYKGQAMQPPTKARLPLHFHWLAEYQPQSA